MAKTSKPLTYLVHPALLLTEEVTELTRKGHNVIACDDLLIGDLVIGPNCYRLSPETISLLPLATKAERLSKYGKKGAKDSD